MILQNIAVIGSGYMGGGIAQTLALAGHDVMVADADADHARAALGRLVAESRGHEEAGLIADGGADTIERHLRAADSIEEATASADYITEAVPEDVELKLQVLRRISAAAPEEAIIATNTSAIALSTLAPAVDQPFLAVHWFNPAPFLPLVELAGVDDGALVAVERMLQAAGKVTVRVPDVPGFLGNRLQFALYKEAASIVEEGLATPEQVDLVVSNSFGYRLPFFGPFAVGDIAGLDVYAGAYETLEGQYGERFRAPESLLTRIAAGDRGLKSGGGLRGIDPARRDELAAYRDMVYVALAELRRELGPPPGL
jgi:3-hydroxybutyryl-CoA dehydrogenase